jgi:hypothetical protein
MPAAAAPPPPPAPPPAAPEARWHIAEAGSARGPLGAADLGALAASGALTASTLVWTAGQDGWKPAGETALAALVHSVPPPLPGA